jgi:hypothetical protein
MLHVGGAMSLVVANDPPVLEKHVARIPAIRVTDHRHQGWLAARAKRLFDRPQVTIQVRIAVHDEEGVTENLARVPQCASRAEERRPVEHILDRQAPPRAIPQRLADHLASIPDEEHDALDPLSAQPFDLVLGERPTGHLHESLRNGLGNGPQPGCEATGEDRHRQHHPNNTFVPSKSKRKRTSSRAAFFIAARRRR